MSTPETKAKRALPAPPGSAVTPTHLDLFSGIGGFALAARWTGWKTIGFAETDQYASRVLRKHWPEVPNYGKRGSGIKLEEGMVLAIEPMINAGTASVKFWADGWTVTTKDNKPSAHFEHTVAIKKGKADVLSTFSLIEEVLAKKFK